jgi:hypothetical protein
MDLANIRSLGVINVDVYCACGDQASVDVSKLPGDLTVPDVRLRLLARNVESGRQRRGRTDWVWQ